MGALSTSSVIERSRLPCRSALMATPAISRIASRKPLRLAGVAIKAVNRDRVGCEASPDPTSGVSPAAELVARRKAGSWRRASASSWSRQPCAAKSTEVRMSEARSWVTSTLLRGSLRRDVIQDTMPLRSKTSRKRTAPGSPVKRSARLSIRNDLLKPGMNGCSVSPMRASDAAYGFF
jgi:hypothetical protein